MFRQVRQYILLVSESLRHCYVGLAERRGYGLQIHLHQFKSDTLLHLIYGAVVLVGTHLLCKQKSGVRLPSAPPKQSGCKSVADDFPRMEEVAGSNPAILTKTIHRSTSGEVSSFSRCLDGFEPHTVCQFNNQLGCGEMVSHEILILVFLVRFQAPLPNNKPFLI